MKHNHFHYHHHEEDHKMTKVGFLRAAVLGANDGIISTASLIIGIASSGFSKSEILMASIAAMIGGTISMAAGEYVSVSSQADAEKADIEREKQEHIEDPISELKELTAIYIKRGLSDRLAQEVAEELSAKDALQAHYRDELGIIDFNRAKPLEAALASSLSFLIGAALPILLVLAIDIDLLIISMSSFTLVLLFGMGALGSKLGGAKILKGASRAAFWGALAMGFTMAIGRLF
jgi:VIT1/CCC1 family predicted Fe2+/Mn2+ transporter